MTATATLSALPGFMINVYSLNLNLTNSNDKNIYLKAITATLEDKNYDLSTKQINSTAKLCPQLRAKLLQRPTRAKNILLIDK